MKQKNVVTCWIGWMMLNFMPNFINNLNRKIINLVKKKNISASFISVNWPLKTEPVPGKASMPVLVRGTWASACVHLVG